MKAIPFRKVDHQHRVLSLGTLVIALHVDVGLACVRQQQSDTIMIQLGIPEAA